MKKLALVHTVNWYDRIITEPFVKPWLMEHPEVEIINILDDSLLLESQAGLGPTKQVIKRLILYFQAAEATGADAIMSTCSTMAIGTSIGREFVNIPLFNIDEPMAWGAINLGRVFGVVGTVPSALPATATLLKQQAMTAEKSIEVKEILCSGAYEALESGNAELHDQLVCDELAKLQSEVDVLILGQASLARVNFQSTVPLLKVGHSGFTHAAKLLNIRVISPD